jgi:hypothetical protein
MKQLTALEYIAVEIGHSIDIASVTLIILLLILSVPLIGNSLLIIRIQQGTQDNTTFTRRMNQLCTSSHKSL